MMTANMTMISAMLTMSTVLKTITIHYFSSEKATTWLFGKLPSPSSWGRILKMVDHNIISEYLPTLYPNWLTTIWTPTHILLTTTSQVIVSSSPLPSPPQNPRLRRPSQGRPSPTPDQVALGKKRQQGTSLPNTKNYIPRSGPSPAPAPGDIITELKMQVTVKQDSTPLILNN